MYWLLDSEPVGVSAFTLPLEMKDPIGHNNLVASFKFADGSIGNFTYCTVGSRSSQGERVEAFMPGGGIVAEDFKKLFVRTGSKQRVQSRLWPAKGYLEQMRSFISRIREGESPEVTVIDGARATIGALMMLESARTLQFLSIDVMETLRRRD